MSIESGEKTGCGYGGDFLSGRPDVKLLRISAESATPGENRYW